MEKRNVCLVNDSFPPLIDGVANAVTNYAEIINRDLGTASVVTPAHPDAHDGDYPFPIIRYPSVDLTRKLGYMAGIPFSARTLQQVEDGHFDIIHSHCPITSTMLSRILRDRIDIPVVLTYHTKFDIDIANAIRSKLLQEEAARILVENISACDEVWTVSRGAGENLRQLGYQGDYIVMPNGVDFPKGRVDDALVAQVCEGMDLPAGVPVFLFVGRMMWYKGIRIILDALKTLDEAGQDYRMVFIGGGTDKPEIMDYAAALQLAQRVFFVEPIHDREKIRAWYCRADLFLFPSTFDTNGLVVREAAACGLASVLIAGSCAAEDSTDGVNGFLIEENAASMAAKLLAVCKNPTAMAQAGENAQRDLYLSWDNAVQAAYERYGAVIDRYRSGLTGHYEKFTDRMFQHMANGLADFNRAQHSVSGVRERYEELRSELHAERDAARNELEARRSHFHSKIRELSEHVERFL